MELDKSSQTAKKLKDTSLVDRRPGSMRPWTVRTVENVILSVTSCSVRKMHHKHVSQPCALGQLVKQASALTHERGHASPQIVSDVSQSVLEISRITGICRSLVGWIIFVIFSGPPTQSKTTCLFTC